MSNTKTIKWPKDWSADEGWPDANSNMRTADGRTWRDFDEELKRQGSSLEKVMRALGKPADDDGEVTS